MIHLVPEMLINEATSGDASKLIDEQDPKSTPKTVWDPGYNVSYLPASVVFDLRVPYHLTEIDYFDGGGTGAISFFTGSYGNWKQQVNDPMDGFNVWKRVSVNVETQYVRLSLDTHNAPLEVILYGTPKQSIPPVPTPAPHTNPLMQDFIGVNAFTDDPIGRIEAFGHVREYHDWFWDEGNGASYAGYPKNQNGFAPSYVPGFDFDQYYGSLKNGPVLVSPAIKASVPWLNGDQDSKPLYPATANPLLPASYVAHADHMFQYAARYGSHSVSSSLLKLAPSQSQVSGLGYLKYFEDWNEQDKWWINRADHFTPYEYSAMASADYDGDMGKMGTTVGVKNADPNAIMVMGGIAAINLDYLKSMKFWADSNRFGILPADVLNLHHYSNDLASTGKQTMGIPPEEDGFKDLVKKVANFRDTYYPKKELWISEFGYDTDPASIQRAPAIGTLSAQEVQAEWLVRSYLELAAAGVDKADAYMLRDTDESNSGQYATSGMVTSKATKWKAKISWYYIYTLKSRLTGMRFDREIPSGNPNVLIYRFKHDNGNDAAYVAWMKTKNNNTLSNFAVPVSEKYAKLITLTPGSKYGVEGSLTVSNSRVAVDVSERPVIVLASASGTFANPIHEEYLLPIGPPSVVNESNLGNATAMVDEQTDVGDVINGGGTTTPASVWNPGSNASIYPASAYIDLGREYNVTKIGFLDGNSSGTVQISAGTPSNWTVLFSDPLTHYHYWNMHPVAVTTRYIRVTLMQPNANFNELVIYGY